MLNLKLNRSLLIITIKDIIKQIKPHEIYNLAAQSHVGVSFEIPDPHNTYIQLLAEIGVFGTLLFSLIFSFIV